MNPTKTLKDNVLKDIDAGLDTISRMFLTGNIAPDDHMYYVAYAKALQEVRSFVDYSYKNLMKGDDNYDDE